MVVLPVVDARIDRVVVVCAPVVVGRYNVGGLVVAEVVIPVCEDVVECDIISCAITKYIG